MEATVSCSSNDKGGDVKLTSDVFYQALRVFLTDSFLHSWPKKDNKVLSTK